MLLMSLDSRLVRSLLSFVACLFLLGLCTGQSRRFQEEWRWSRFGLDDGLPSLRIEAITEAKDGTLWVQTAKGPAWFDGFKWMPVELEYSSPLDAREPIIPFGESGILISTQASRLFRIERSGATELALPARYGKYAIVHVLGDGEGGFFLILVDAMSGTEFRFMIHDGTEFTEIELPEVLSGIQGIHMVLGSGGEVFLVTETKAWAFTAGRFQDAITLPNPGWHAEAITSDGRGRIVRLLSTRRAAHANRDYSVAKMARLGQDDAGTEQTELWELAADAELLHRVWSRPRGFVGQADLNRGRSIVVLEGRESQSLEGGRWTRLEPLPSMFLGASCLFLTSGGRLCVGTVRGLSICHYDSALWAKPEIDDIDTGLISKILGDHEGDLWVIGRKGLFRFPRDEPLWSSDKSRGRRQGVLAVDLIEDQQNRLWASDRKGVIYRRDEGSWKALSEAEIVSGLMSATFLGVDKVGPWVQAECKIKGLPSDRLLRWSGTRFEDWTPWNRSRCGLFLDMAVDANGTLWFAGNQGVSRYRDGRWKHWDRDSGLSRNQVDAIALDATGRIWFLHAGLALGYLSKQGEVKYTNHSGLPSYERPRSLERGAGGRLWSHTDTRLRLLPGGSKSPHGDQAEDSESLDEWVDIDFPPGWAQQFYMQVHPTKDLLYFLNNHGTLASFNIRLGDSRPPILALGMPRLHRGGVSLSWKSRSWYGSLPAARVLTRHRLDSEPWSAWSSEHRLDLWNQTSGEHQIRVQARNRLGREGVVFASLPFDIPAPFWMRPAFYVPISTSLSLLLMTLFLWAWNTRRHARILEFNRKKLETLAAMSPVGIVQADSKGVIQFRNQSGEEIAGIDLSNRLPEDYLEAIHEEDRFRVRRDWLTASRTGDSFESRFRFSHPDGSTRWVMGQAVPELDDRGRVIAYVGTLTDITEMELAAAERERLEARLMQAQKLESVGQLAGGIAHDFNNLLQVILGYTDFLDERLRVDGREDPDLAQIKHSAERATELTRQLLAFSRKQQGSPRPLNPVQAIEGVLTMMRRVLPESISIEFQPSDEVGMVCMDDNQFEQILLNLCLNARDAMPEGGLLRISLENVEVMPTDGRSGSIVAPGRYVVLRVIDTGTGMSDTVSKRLFEPFFTTKEPGKGTGLGLAMVYGIVCQNEGLVEVDSTLGEGTELRIYIPRIEAQLETGTETIVEKHDGRGETILIAEDEELVRELARTMLERAGYRVLTAVDGEDAIEKFQEHRDEISVVLLDAIMPRCGGREVYERLKTLDTKAAFLFSSGHPANQLPGTFLEENRLILIPKPYKAKQLLKEVRGVLDRQERE